MIFSSHYLSAILKGVIKSVNVHQSCIDFFCYSCVSEIKHEAILSGFAHISVRLTTKK